MSTNGSQMQQAHDLIEDAPVIGAIFGSLAKVKEEINGLGVGKERENKQQHFNYRGIDDALNAFSGPFARHQVLPTMVYETTHRDVVRTKNSEMSRCIVSLVCTFLSLKDGSSITVGPIEGEAFDVLDKSTTKACSVALRNLLFLTFTVPFGPEEPEQYEGGSEVGQSFKIEAVADAAEPAKISLGVSQMTMLGNTLSRAGRSEEWLLENYGSVTRDNFKKAIAYIRDSAVSASQGDDEQ